MVTLISFLIFILSNVLFAEGDFPSIFSGGSGGGGGGGSISIGDTVTGGQQGRILFVDGGVLSQNDNLRVKINDSSRRILVASDSFDNTLIGNAEPGNGVAHNFAGNSSVMIGWRAGNSVSAGSGHVFIGYRAGNAASTIVYSNIAIGVSAGVSLGSSNAVIALGAQAIQFGANDFSDSICIGARACENINNAQRTVAIGREAGRNVQSGENVFVGDRAGTSLTTGTSNVLVGTSSGRVGTTLSFSTCVGFESCENSNVNNSVAIGYRALRAGSGNSVAVGMNAGLNSTAGENVFVGHEAGQNSTAAFNSVFVGKSACQLNVSGSHNTCIGAYAGQNNIGAFNVFFGSESGALKTGGARTIAVGYRAARMSASGDLNDVIAVGDQALSNLSANANYNIAIGSNAGTAITSGTENILIGHAANTYTATSNREMHIRHVTNDVSFSDSYLWRSNDIEIRLGFGRRLVLEDSVSSSTRILLQHSNSGTSAADGGRISLEDDDVQISNLEGGKIIFDTVNSGIVLQTLGSDPTCGASNRGMIRYFYGGMGVADEIRACMKNAAGIYSWQTVHQAL